VGGLVGALLVTLAAVGVYVGFRALNRDGLDIRPDPVDYLAAAATAQEAGVVAIYPASLPDGWIATSVDLRDGADPTWGLGMLTSNDEFAGVQQGEDLDDLVVRYVDERATEGDKETIKRSIAPRWRTFSDEGGDQAYAAQPAELEGAWVIVFGSASKDDLRTLVGLLTTDQR
jgi:Protein of unknown function (DUF4245)